MQGIHCTSYSPLGSIAAARDSDGKIVADDPTVLDIANKLSVTPAQVCQTSHTSALLLTRRQYHLPHSQRIHFQDALTFIA